MGKKCLAAMECCISMRIFVIISMRIFVIISPILSSMIVYGPVTQLCEVQNVIFVRHECSECSCCSLTKEMKASSRNVF